MSSGFVYLWPPTLRAGRATLLHVNVTARAHSEVHLVVRKRQHTLLEVRSVLPTSDIVTFKVQLAAQDIPVIQLHLYCRSWPQPQQFVPLVTLPPSAADELSHLFNNLARLELQQTAGHLPFSAREQNEVVGLVYRREVAPLVADIATVVDAGPYHKVKPACDRLAPFLHAQGLVHLRSTLQAYIEFMGDLDAEALLPRPEIVASRAGGQRAHYNNHFALSEADSEEDALSQHLPAQFTQPHQDQQLEQVQEHEQEGKEAEEHEPAGGLGTIDPHTAEEESPQQSSAPAQASGSRGISSNDAEDTILTTFIPEQHSHVVENPILLLYTSPCPSPSPSSYQPSCASSVIESLLETTELLEELTCVEFEAGQVEALPSTEPLQQTSCNNEPAASYQLPCTASSLSALPVERSSNNQGSLPPASDIPGAPAATADCGVLRCTAAAVWGFPNPKMEEQFGSFWFSHQYKGMDKFKLLLPLLILGVVPNSAVVSTASSVLLLLGGPPLPLLILLGWIPTHERKQQRDLSMACHMASCALTLALGLRHSRLSGSVTHPVLVCFLARFLIQGLGRPFYQPILFARALMWTVLESACCGVALLGLGVAWQRALLQQLCILAVCLVMCLVLEVRLRRLFLRHGRLPDGDQQCSPISNHFSDGSTSKGSGAASAPGTGQQNMTMSETGGGQQQQRQSQRESNLSGVSFGSQLSSSLQLKQGEGKGICCGLSEACQTGPGSYALAACLGFSDPCMETAFLQQQALWPSWLDATSCITLLCVVLAVFWMSALPLVHCMAYGLQLMLSTLLLAWPASQLPAMQRCVVLLLPPEVWLWLSSALLACTPSLQAAMSDVSVARPVPVAMALELFVQGLLLPLAAQVQFKVHVPLALVRWMHTLLVSFLCPQRYYIGSTVTLHSTAVFLMSCATRFCHQYHARRKFMHIHSTAAVDAR